MILGRFTRMAALGLIVGLGPSHAQETREHVMEFVRNSGQSSREAVAHGTEPNQVPAGRPLADVVQLTQTMGFGRYRSAASQKVHMFAIEFTASETLAPSQTLGVEAGSNGREPASQMKYLDGPNAPLN